MQGILNILKENCDIINFIHYKDNNMNPIHLYKHTNHNRNIPPQFESNL